MPFLVVVLFSFSLKSKQTRAANQVLANIPRATLWTTRHQLRQQPRGRCPDACGRPGPAPPGLRPPAGWRRDRFAPAAAGGALGRGSRPGEGGGRRSRSRPRGAARCYRRQPPRSPPCPLPAEGLGGGSCALPRAGASQGRRQPPMAAAVRRARPALLRAGGRRSMPPAAGRFRGD